MFYIILALVVVAWMTINEYRHNRYYKRYVGVVFLFSSFFAFGFALVILMLSVMFSTDIGSVSQKTDIVSIADSVETHGTFVLGTGSINSEIYYFYYVKDGDGYRVEKRMFTDLILFDDQTNDAYFVDFTPNVELKWFYFNVGKHKSSELHVPKGTIIKNVYDLDLK